MALFTVKVSTKVFERRVGLVATVIGEGQFSPLRQPMIRAFRRHIKSEYVRILRTEMPRSRELDILNKGFVVRRGGEIFALRGVDRRSKVGTAGGGRFLTASWTPIAQAVAQEEVNFDPLVPAGVVRVGSVSAASIRNKTAFSWAMRDAKGRFRARGSAQPFGGQYIQVLEKGGSFSVPAFGRLIRDTRVIRGRLIRQQGNQWVWRIRHRRGKRLHPEDGVFVWEMEKRVSPIGMFKRALFTKTPVAMIDVKKSLVNYLTSRFIGFQRGGS